jgi:hypothetical protein
LGGGVVQSAEVAQGSPRPPALPPVLELLAPLDPLAVLLLLDPLAPPDPPAALLLDALAPPLDPLDTLLLDAPPPLADDEVEADEDASPADVDPAPVVEGSLSLHPRRSEDMPVRTETNAMREAKRGTQGMSAIVPPPPDRLART